MLAAQEKSTVCNKKEKKKKGQDQNEVAYSFFFFFLPNKISAAPQVYKMQFKQLGHVGMHVLPGRIGCGIERVKEDYV